MLRYEFIIHKFPFGWTVDSQIHEKKSCSNQYFVKFMRAFGVKDEKVNNAT